MIEVLVIRKPKTNQIPLEGTLECSKEMGDDLVLLGETQTLNQIRDFVEANPEVAEGVQMRESTREDLVTAFELHKGEFETRGKMVGHLLKYYYNR